MTNADTSAPAPRVSVVIIFFNSERFFVEAIESVLAQDFRDFELLLVDDGSSDSSTRIALDYARAQPDRIRYLEHPGHANCGMSATRNLGVLHSRGELIAFLDSDDVWMPAKLREQVAIIDRLREVDAVCGTARYWRSWNGGADRMVRSGHVQGRPIAPPDALVAVYPLGRGKAPCPSDLLVRRSAFDAVGGFEASFKGPLQLYEDQGFLTKLYLARTVYFADEVWINYRLHDGQCVAQARDTGTYDYVRSHFLEWLKAYVGRSDRRRDLRIRLALARALLPYRHPGLSRLLRSRRTLLKALGRR
jgi:glycosyltransferase involved in cell wall biosynthesis